MSTALFADPVHQSIPLDQIQLPDQNIGGIDTEAIEQLTASIKELGVLQPITVVALTDDTYEVAFGRHRYVAATEAGLNEIPCIVRSFVDEPERLFGMLVENLHRRTIDPVSEGQAYARLVELGMTQADLADKVGRSQSHISKRLALAGLPEAAHEALGAGRLTISGAEAMARIKDRSKVEGLAKGNGQIQDWKINEVVQDEKREATRQKLRDEQTAAGRIEVTDAKETYGGGTYVSADDDDATHFFLSQYGAVALLKERAGDDAATPAKKKETTAEKRERIAFEKREQLFTSVPQAHREFVVAHLAGKVNTRAAQTFVNAVSFVGLIEDGSTSYVDVEEVATALGLEVAASDDADDGGWDRACDALEAFANKSANNLLTIVAARELLGIADTGYGFRSLRHRADGAGLPKDTAVFYAWLTSAGYKPSDEEQAELDRVAGTPAPTEVPAGDTPVSDIVPDDDEPKDAE